MESHHKHPVDTHFGYKGLMMPGHYQGSKSRSANIKFRLQCAQTTMGETVKVTGSAQELGNWDPNKGLQLQTNPSEFPMWKGQVAVDTGETAPMEALEYKYVIVKEGGSESQKRWEPLAGNRAIDNLAKIKDVVVEDVYGRSGHVREDAVQYPPQMEPLQAIQEDGLSSSEQSQSMPDLLKAKSVRKVREVNNIVDKYQ